MIRSAEAMRAALKGKKPRFCGVVLFQGASALDGKPIVAIANKILSASSNEKTGNMVQTFIIRSDVNPYSALKSGDDFSVCGNCRHRPIKKHKGREYGRCYVQVARSVVVVWKAFGRGRYALPGVDYDAKILPELFRGLRFRMGTYGDPAAVPFQIWRACTLHVAKKTGYSHQWKNRAFAAFALLCMASCDEPDEAIEAQAMGWRSFRVNNAGDPKLSYEVQCPASKEMGFKTNCAACAACGGNEAKAKANIVINEHGPNVRLAA